MIGGNENRKGWGKQKLRELREAKGWMERKKKKLKRMK